MKPVQTSAYESAAVLHLEGYRRGPPRFAQALRGAVVLRIQSLSVSLARGDNVELPRCRPARALCGCALPRVCSEDSDDAGLPGIKGKMLVRRGSWRGDGFVPATARPWKISSSADPIMQSVVPVAVHRRYMSCRLIGSSLDANAIIHGNRCTQCRQPDLHGRSAFAGPTSVYGTGIIGK